MPDIYRVRDVRKTYGDTHALEGINLRISAGQRLGIVGESGSGKSTLSKILVGLIKPTSGDVWFKDHHITAPNADLTMLHRGVQMVFQDPRSSLNPRLPIGTTITEPLTSPIWAEHLDAATLSAKLDEVLTAVGLIPEWANRYPHHFSGGERQRIAIARAIISQPEVLIADEAVSALDVSVRAHVLNLIGSLVDAYGLTLIFVSHDLAVVRHICDSVVVLHDGVVVEQGDVDQVYTNPQHDYTKQLLAAIPTIKTPHSL